MNKHKRAQKFLADRLEESLDWSGVDEQFELAFEFAEILGPLTPKALDDAFINSEPQIKLAYELLVGRKVPNE